MHTCTHAHMRVRARTHTTLPPHNCVGRKVLRRTAVQRGMLLAGLDEFPCAEQHDINTFLSYNGPFIRQAAEDEC